MQDPYDAIRELTVDPTAAQLAGGRAVAVRLDVYGERLRVETDHAEVVHQVLRDFRPFVVGYEAMPEGVIDRGHVPGSLPTPDAGGERVMRVRINDVPIQRRGLFSEYWVRVHGQLADALSHRFLLLHAGGLIANAEGLPPDAAMASHSAAPYHGTAFLGLGESGKTTLVLAGHHLGYPSLGDDLIALEWRTGRVFTMPLPYRPRAETWAFMQRWEGSPAWVMRRGYRPTVYPQAGVPLRRLWVMHPWYAREAGPEPPLVHRLLMNVRTGGGLTPRDIMTRLLTGLSHTTIQPLPPVQAFTESLQDLRPLYRNLTQPGGGV